MKQRLVDALGDDPHLSPPPLKGEETPLTFTLNGEACAPIQCRNPGPCSFPLVWGKARMGVHWSIERFWKNEVFAERDLVKQRLVYEALGDDPHLNPPPLKGEETPPARKGNAEA